MISFGQFKGPEPTIIRPEVILPENQLNDFAKSYNKKNKKTIIGKKITEYDINGNITKEIDPGISSTTTTLYTYKNNILIEKITTTISDSKIVKRNNAENAAYIRESLKRGEQSVVVASFDDEKKLNTYKAILDKKNRVISYISEQKENDGYRPIDITKQVKIVYDKDKIVEITTNNTEKKHYFYEKNSLVRSESLIDDDDSKSSYTNDYVYDSNNNLVLIKSNSKGIFKGKPFQYSSVNDSAVYDNKRNLVWAYYISNYMPSKGNEKKQFITYKYDANNKLIESSQYENGIEHIKNEYFYENNLITKVLKTYFVGVPVKTTGSKTYNYTDGKLLEYNEIDPFTNSEKQCIYEYDEAKHLKKITEIRKYTDSRTGKITNHTSTADFSFKENTLTFKNQIGQLEIYDFF
ncbi:hypothetical protein B0A79_13925 [Flavobacterium piscis]|uniref:RHS repeat protein n=2 Tax=Flavobacterium piscis TaxID=1114874 RepID=A0ABX2XEY7_9FLAO|nr:hypothetical protein FLP_18945 [Flavobacterium piscis]OXG03489.1 hypothetical protein B0A79_13925 [Flavobacterium piscis]